MPLGLGSKVFVDHHHRFLGSRVRTSLTRPIAERTDNPAGQFIGGGELVQDTFLSDLFTERLLFLPQVIGLSIEAWVEVVIRRHEREPGAPRVHRCPILLKGIGVLRTGRTAPVT
jgi:hypothetical protein